MKTTIKTFVKKISFTLLVAAAFVLPSCNIGLGEALDLKGPTVMITSPESRENVKDKFTISGIVVDDVEIGTVTVRITFNDEFKGEWKNEGFGWTHRAIAGEPYSLYGNATWIISPDRRSVMWSINDVNPSGNGVFKITVTAVDATGNSSEESTKSRDVIIDGKPPLIEIAQPNLSAEMSVFDIPDYKDITKINMFMTGDFTITGYAKDDNTIKFVDLRLKDAESGEEYFSKRLDIDTDPDIDSLRAWEMKVVLDECALGRLDSKKHVLMVYTNTADAAGNSNNDLVFQGYTCLWRDADIPWIAMSELIGTSFTIPKQVYSGSPLQGTAYDDTAIVKVTVTVKNVDSSGNIQDVVAGFDNKVLYEYTPKNNGEEDDYDNNVPFNLLTPEDCEKFYIELRAYDNKGNESEATAGYIKVEDKTYPAIDIAYSDGYNTNIKADENGKDENGAVVSPKQKGVSDTLFGDASGNFTLNIKAFDDTQVTSIKMVYIPNALAAKAVDYSNSKYTGWTTTTDGIVVTDITPTDTKTTDDSIGIIRKVYKAYKQMNLFGDGTGNTLGIDGSTKKMGNQTFVFRIEDNNENAMTKTLTIQGDVEPPTVSIDSIDYYQDGKTKTGSYTNNTTLDPFQAESKVKVYGTVYDNSSKVWGLTKAFDLDKPFANRKFLLKLGDAVVDSTVTPTGDGYGKFEAEIKGLTGASLILNASLSDYNNNTSINQFTCIVNTETPSVEEVSSTDNDACYTSGNNINIFIRFNMQLKYSGGSPTLKLNNNATATIDTATDKTPSGVYKDQFYFKYTVGSASEEIEDLDVTSMNLNNAKIYMKNSSGGDTEITDFIKQKIDGVLSKKNLASAKDITILVNKPEVTKLEFTESTGVLEIVFNKKVAKGTGNVTISQLKSNGTTIGVDRVPPVFLENEFKKYFKSALGSYYEAGMNGNDTSAKYILKYQYNCDGTQDSGASSNLISDYESTGKHILTQGIRGNKVTTFQQNSDGTTTVKIEFGKNPLPCKGAKYRIHVPENIVYHEKGGSKNYGSNAQSKDIIAAGVEIPVIRVNDAGTTVKNSGTKYVATQPLSTTFKIDCQTPGAKLQYSYVKGTYNTPRKVGSTEQYECTIKNGVDQLKKIDGSVSDSPATAYANYTGAVKIGVDDSNNDIPYNRGLRYSITVKASANGSVEEGKQTLYRTVIEFNDFNTLRSTTTKKEGGYTNWYGASDDTLAFFVCGGDNDQGPNTTNGLPMEWDKTGKKIMCSETTSGGNTFYMVSWKITKKMYFWMLAGICDSTTTTDGKPAYACCFQNCFAGRYKDYPIEPGEYMILYHKTYKNNSFDSDDHTNVEPAVNDAGKPFVSR